MKMTVIENLAPRDAGLPIPMAPELRALIRAGEAVVEWNAAAECLAVVRAAASRRKRMNLAKINAAMDHEEAIGRAVLSVRDAVNNYLHASGKSGLTGDARKRAKRRASLTLFGAPQIEAAQRMVAGDRQ